MSPRAPLHRGDYVGVPHHERGNVPHWSRWGKTATTFGPTGRVVATVAIVSFLLVTFFFQFFLFWIIELIVAVAVLRDIWRRAWVVPGEVPITPVTSTGPSHDAGLDRAELRKTVVLALAAMAICAAVLYGPDVVKLITIWSTVLFGGYLLYRGYLSR